MDLRRVTIASTFFLTAVSAAFAGKPAAAPTPKPSFWQRVTHPGTAKEPASKPKEKKPSKKKTAKEAEPKSKPKPTGLLLPRKVTTAQMGATVDKDGNYVGPHKVATERGGGWNLDAQNATALPQDPESEPGVLPNIDQDPRMADRLRDMDTAQAKQDQQVSAFAAQTSEALSQRDALALQIQELQKKIHDIHGFTDKPTREDLREVPLATPSPASQAGTAAANANASPTPTAEEKAILAKWHNKR
jgi:hypothetical protein